jgi:hypothetical protein
MLNSVNARPSWRKFIFWDTYCLPRGLRLIPTKSRIFWSGNHEPMYIKSEVSLDWLVITADLFQIFQACEANHKFIEERYQIQLVFKME